MPRKSQKSKNAETAPAEVDEEEDEDPIDDEEDGEEEASATRELANAANALTEVARDIKRTSHRKVLPHQHVSRGPFMGKKRLARRYYQNGVPLMSNRLQAREVELLEQLKPGTYFGGMVQVVQQRNGSNTDVDIRYSNKSRDQMNKTNMAFRSLEIALASWVASGPMTASQLEAVEA